MAGLAGVSFSGREDGEQGLKDDVCPDRAGGGSWGSRGTEGGGYRSPGARGSGRAGAGPLEEPGKEPVFLYRPVSHRDPRTCQIF